MRLAQLVELCGAQRRREYTNMDWAVQAETLLNRVGSTATAFAMNANTLSALATIKRFEATSQDGGLDSSHRLRAAS